MVRYTLCVLGSIPSLAAQRRWQVSRCGGSGSVECEQRVAVPVPCQATFALL